jgi:hypothetical protein
LWRPDTVITDYEGTEMFVLLDQVQQMRSYEAIFGDLDGRRLVCIKRHLITAFWRDGYYFCTYKPNYKNQRPLIERDVDNKKVYPFSYLQVSPMKGRFYYRMFDNQEGLSPPKMKSENPWLGFMVVCCTPIVRAGKWTASFRRKNQNMPTIHVDQWRNCVDIGPGNDVLAALCMAYVFDRYQCQPLITVVGGEKEQYLQPDDHSIESDEGDEGKTDIEEQMFFENAPDGKRQSTDISSNGYQQPYVHDDNNEYDDDAEEQNGHFDEFVNSSHEQERTVYTSDDNKNDDDFQSHSLVNANDIDILTSSYSNEQPPSIYNTNDDTTSDSWLTSNANDNDTYSSYPTDSISHIDGPYVNNTYEDNLYIDDDGDSDSRPRIV